eukprot:3864812-Rhodomonas_salina.1
MPLRSAEVLKGQIETFRFAPLNWRENREKNISSLQKFPESTGRDYLLSINEALRMGGEPLREYIKVSAGREILADPKEYLSNFEAHPEQARLWAAFQRGDGETVEAMITEEPDKWNFIFQGNLLWPGLKGEDQLVPKRLPDGEVSYNTFVAIQPWAWPTPMTVLCRTFLYIADDGPHYMHPDPYEHFQLTYRCIEKILLAGGDPNLSIVPQCYSVTATACYAGRLDVLQLCVEYGGDFCFINHHPLANHWETTAVSIACNDCNFEVLKWLVDNGA